MNFPSSFAANSTCGDLFDAVPEPSRLRMDLDFSSTYNLFNLGNDMDLGLSDPDIEFLTSIPLLAPRAEANTQASTLSRLVSVVSPSSTAEERLV